MLPADVQVIGHACGHQVDWLQVAQGLGQLSCSGLLRKEKNDGKKSGQVAQFACTAGGKVHGPLGPDMVMATVNLIAQGLHVDASKKDFQPHTPANPVSRAAHAMRQKYIAFLVKSFPWLGRLEQSALLEDDALESHFSKELEKARTFWTPLAAAAKCESDRTSGPGCGVGPKGLLFLLDRLG